MSQENIKQLVIRVTESEREYLHSLAKEEGLSLSALIRTALDLAPAPYGKSFRMKEEIRKINTRNGSLSHGRKKGVTNRL